MRRLIVLTSILVAFGLTQNFSVSNSGSGTQQQNSLSNPIATEQLNSSISGDVLTINSMTWVASDGCGGNTWPVIGFSSSECGIQELIIDNINI